MPPLQVDFGPDPFMPDPLYRPVPLVSTQIEQAMSESQSEVRTNNGSAQSSRSLGVIVLHDMPMHAQHHPLVMLLAAMFSPARRLVFQKPEVLLQPLTAIRLCTDFQDVF